MFISSIHGMKISPLSEDKLLLKGSSDGKFSVKVMYRSLDLSPDIDLSFHSVWNLVIPSQIGFSLEKLSGEKCSPWISLNVVEELLQTNIFFVKRMKRL